jgi:hypothetical protein
MTAREPALHSLDQAPARSRHGNPFTAVSGPPYLAEGEVAVVEPLGGNPFRVVGRIRVDGWSEYMR